MKNLKDLLIKEKRDDDELDLVMTCGALEYIDFIGKKDEFVEYMHCIDNQFNNQYFNNTLQGFLNSTVEGMDLHNEFENAFDKVCGNS